VSLSLVVLIAVLFGTGTYLLLQRTLTRIVLGVGLLANGLNVLIIAAGARQGEPPLVGRTDTTDSVPQALVLTAIVIGFAVTAFLLALAWRSWTIDGSDAVEDDVEDRRIARADAADAADDARRDVHHHEDVDL
jgi:multicomponent Na+:H+ antiporter subunit C